ncbi:hypothetical protein BSKO_11238 [Bryopsis sp. KO-2023]|nr:hypothetical protein BSKO_11238 [Bryopsis sp. KO-2023]
MFVKALTLTVSVAGAICISIWAFRSSFRRRRGSGQGVAPAAAPQDPQAEAPGSSLVELIQQHLSHLERLKEQLADLQGSGADPEKIQGVADTIAAVEWELLLQIAELQPGDLGQAPWDP